MNITYYNEVYELLNKFYTKAVKYENNNSILYSNDINKKIMIEYYYFNLLTTFLYDIDVCCGERNDIYCKKTGNKKCVAFNKICTPAFCVDCWFKTGKKNVIIRYIGNMIINNDKNNNDQNNVTGVLLNLKNSIINGF